MIDIPKHKAEQREAIQKQCEEFFKKGKEPKKANQGEVAHEQRGLSEAERYRFNEAKSRI